MGKQLTAVAILALLAGTAMAAPRESQSYPNPVNVNATNASEIFTVNFTGSDGGGAYSASHVLLTGTLTRNPAVANTWPADIWVDITPPSGAMISVQLSDIDVPTDVVSISIDGNLGTAVSPAGTWSFDIYDTWADAGGDPQSVLTDIVVTLDDTPISPGETQSSAIDLGTLVDEVPVSVEVVVGPEAVKWYKFVADDSTYMAGRRLTVSTLNSTSADNSEFAVYNSDGSAGWTNNDSGGTFFSYLAFGANGQPGEDAAVADLPAGQYYLAVSSWNTDFFLPYIAESEGPGGTFQLDILQTFVGLPTAPDATDLGTLVDGTPVSVVADVPADTVVWYTVTVGDCSEAAGRQLIITTMASTVGDSELGLYTNDGLLVDAIDDFDGTLRSQLSYGYDSEQGDLAAGRYYIAVGSYNTDFFEAGWHAVSFSDNTNSFQLDVVQNTSFPPTATAAATVDGLGGALLTVTVVPGVNPASTSIVVRGDLSGLGGSATQQFYDDGTHGDVTGGDNIFSYQATLPAGDPDGTEYTVSYEMTDAQAHSVTGTIALAADVGNLMENANVPTGTGELTSLAGVFSADADVDMYRINICDPANFSVTTEGTEADTQLFLFNTDGTGVAFNDDLAGGIGGISTITNQFVTTAGEYYVAVSRWDVDPVDSGGMQIWADTPYDTERAPDGVSPGGSVAGWTGASFGVVSYTLSFTGACYSTGGAACSVADVGVAGGLPGQDRLLDNNDFIAFINFFFAQNAAADMGIAGGLPGQDGLFDNNDFIAFISHFFNDSVNCHG